MRSTYGRRCVARWTRGSLDSAASLTYYVLLSLVPTITLMLAIVGLVGRDPETTDAILEVIKTAAPPTPRETARGALETRCRIERALRDRPRDRADRHALRRLALRVAFSRAAKGLGGGTPPQRAPPSAAAGAGDLRRDVILWRSSCSRS